MSIAGPDEGGMTADRQAPPGQAKPGVFVVGIMKMEVEGRNSDHFNKIVTQAIVALDAAFAQEPCLQTQSLSFSGPHLTPGAGNYAPLDFLEIGLAEKLERDLPFLLIVTEVDLSSSSLAYTLALPSQLTNIAVLSTRRLSPGFWGDEPDCEKAATRLARLMLHSFGHLVALSHERDRSNVMYPFEQVEDLDSMKNFTDAQLGQIARVLPQEAHAQSTRDAKLRFICWTLVHDCGPILRAVMRANPLRLLTRMPTMLAAALSVIVVLLFGAETWDVASAVSVPQILSFSVMCLAAAAFVLYRAFAFDALLSRDRRITESGIVTTAATILSLLLTLLAIFSFLGGLMYLVIISVFPERLMESWPGAGGATTALDHLKLSLFLAAIGVLAGSLGGRSDSRDLVRGVLFITEDT